MKISNDQKDLLISELKAENFELRQRKINVQNIGDEVTGMDRSCSRLQDEKVSGRKS